MKFSVQKRPNVPRDLSSPRLPQQTGQNVDVKGLDKGSSVENRGVENRGVENRGVENKAGKGVQQPVDQDRFSNQALGQVNVDDTPLVNTDDLRRQVDTALADKSGRSFATLSDDALKAASTEQKAKLITTALKAKFNIWNRLGLGKASKMVGLQGFDHDALLRRTLLATDHPDKLDGAINKIGRRSFRTFLRRTKDKTVSKLYEATHKSVTPGDWDAFSPYLEKVFGSKPTQSSTQILMDGEVVPQILKDIKGATQSIDMQLHEAHDDHVGMQVFDALAAKAKEGVQVRVMLDGYHTELKPEVVQGLKAAGVQFDIKPPPLMKDHLDHRKVWVIDGQTGFTGGANLGANYHEKYNDQQTRIKGPAVDELQAAFEGSWAQRKLPAGKFDGQKRADGPQDTATGDIHVVKHDGGFKDENIKTAYLRAIQTAEDLVQVANPYFGDADIVQALCDAAQRGCKVEVVLPRENNQTIMRDAARVHYDQMLNAGVDVYEFTERMAHLKVAVFDGKACTFGSSNLDARSLEFNDELNVFTVNPDMAQEFQAKVFEKNRPHFAHMKGSPEGKLHPVRHFVLQKAMDFL